METQTQAAPLKPKPVAGPKKPRKRNPNNPPPGPVSLFRYKVRSPVSLTLTVEHHEKANRNARRLGLTRADFIGLLIDQYADGAQRPAAAQAEQAEQAEQTGESA